MSTIAAGTTSSAALVLTPDTTGTAVLATNGSTTALTITAGQATSFAKNVSLPAGTASAAPFTIGSMTQVPQASGDFGAYGETSSAFQACPATSFGNGVIPPLRIYRTTANSATTNWTSGIVYSIFGVSCNIDVATYMIELFVNYVKSGTTNTFSGLGSTTFVNNGTSVCTFSGISESFVGAGTSGVSLNAVTYSATVSGATLTSPGTYLIYNPTSVADWQGLGYLRGVITCTTAGTFVPSIRAGGSIFSPDSVYLRTGSYITLRRGAFTSGTWA